MKTKPSLLIIFLILLLPSFAESKITESYIDSLNNKALKLKDSNPEGSLLLLKKTLSLANSIQYNSGVFESYRVLGVTFQYLGKKDSSIIYISRAFNNFKKINDQEGLIRSLNNLGNFHLNYDNNKALYFYSLALKKSKKYKPSIETAGCYLNIGIIYKRKKEYAKAILYQKKALEIFQYLKNYLGISKSHLNIGNAYSENADTVNALQNYNQAYEIAKTHNLSVVLATINHTIAKIYIGKKDFEKSKRYINEGIKIAEQLNKDLVYDYILDNYFLEKAQGNYKKALSYLEDISQRDSVYYEESTNSIYHLSDENQKNLEKQKAYEIKIERDKKNKIILWATIVVTFLSFILIFILIKSKRKAEKNNSQLLQLNKEVSQQKENLNQINHRLEEIIAERTRDLLSKNQKLSEYSSHLSHQIRGPVATLKGLVLLVDDDLIEEKECIVQMKKCINEIDDQIMDINKALHDPERKGLGKKSTDGGNL